MTAPGSSEIAESDRGLGSVAGLAPELAGAKEGAGSPPLASASERFTSYDVDAFEVPGGREENWRFTPLRRMRGLHDGSATFDGVAVVTVHGAGPGVGVETVGRDDPRLGEGGVPADRVAAAAWSAFREATVVTLDGTPGPVTVAVTGPGEGATAAGHVQLRTTPHAEATVVVEQRGSGALADNLEVVLADGSRLTLVVTEEWSDDAVHVGAQHLRIGRDATLRATSVALGGDLVRISPTVTYRGPGGDAELVGLGFADAGQHLEQRLLVDHAVPHCRSNVLYKNALQGVQGVPNAHTVWVGDVLIRAAAESTETFEFNRNLVLTPHARADSVPNLEIETGEIAGAGHASATGRFDDEQLFYLQSRGVPADVARRLVVRGFFGEILSRITLPELRERLEAAIEAELAVTGS
jgi:Fe-S cluster assembly protein SufD